MDRKNIHMSHPLKLQVNIEHHDSQLFFVSSCFLFASIHWQCSCLHFSVSMSVQPLRPGVSPQRVHAIQLTHTSTDTIDLGWVENIGSCLTFSTTGESSSCTLTETYILQATLAYWGGEFWFTPLPVTNIPWKKNAPPQPESNFQHRQTED